MSRDQKYNFKWNTDKHLLGWSIEFLGAAMSLAIGNSMGWVVFHFIVAPMYIPYWIIKHTAFIHWLGKWVVSI